MITSAFKLKRGLPLALGLAASVSITTLSHAQVLHPTGDRPSFEVATIKPWNPAASPSPPPSDGTTPPRKVMKVAPVGVTGQATDRIDIILPVSLLIASAYNLPVGSEGRRILGPEWLHQNEQYEIQAKIDDTLFAAMQKMSPDEQHQQVSLMEQSLLADRFKLKLHFETREMPVYELVLDKERSGLVSAKDGEPSKLSTVSTLQGSEMTATAVTLDEFARSPLLTGPAGARPVINRTGLKGSYDFTLKWRPDSSTPSDSDEPSLFTAIREQLGVRLVPSKAPAEVLVVDHIEHPSPN